MNAATNHPDWWSIDLEGMPHFEAAMQRVYAWYECAIIDRVPVRFMAHNAAFNSPASGDKSPAQLRTLWFDAEYQVDQFIQSITGKRFHGETFPIFSPNLSPDVYAAFYGTELEFGEVTSWSHPIVNGWNDVPKLRFSRDNVYFRKIEDLTRVALEKCPSRSLVGYTDFHPGEDCAMACGGPTQLCLDLYEDPELARELIRIASVEFSRIFDYFDQFLKAARQPSSTWIGTESEEEELAILRRLEGWH